MYNIDDDILAKIKELYCNQNHSVAYVCRELNITIARFRRIRKLYNLHNNRHVQRLPEILSKHSLEEIHAYYKEHSRAETMEHFNISQQNIKHLVSKYCWHHSIEEKVALRAKTCEKMYGVSCVLQRPDIRAASHSEQSLAKMVNTQRNNNMRKFGVASMWERPDVKEKSRNTNLKRFGTEHGWQTTEEGRKRLKEIHLDRSYQQRECDTKRKNNSFNKSSKEEEFYQALLKQFDASDVVRQYASEVYPFNCDFFIKPLNLYVECNFHWTHGKRRWNDNSQACLDKLNEWKSKSVHSEFYKCAIDVWTRRDVTKFSTAKNNKINIAFIYPKQSDSVYLIHGNEIACSCLDEFIRICKSEMLCNN